VRAFSIRRLVRQATLGVPEIELDDLWRCTTCGSCQAQCPRGVGQIPVGRIGEPDDVARCVTFLAADEANWITGSTLTINGGAFMD
jgi:NAD(P)-dependent dehydrogenase (short-subunit alcohol dehydrogenase family)